MIYAFLDFEFDEERWELRRDDAVVKVPPKVMETLHLLLCHRQRVVSSDELMDKIWPNVTVTESSVMKSIRLAREALDDDGDVQRAIKTVRGRGYRFVADVQEKPTKAISEDPFVERDAELVELSAALDKALVGRASFFLLSGDAGMGKTRVAEIFATRARERGVAVRWGRCCEEGGAPELWPWIQILRAIFEDRDPDEVTDPDIAEVARILLGARGAGGEGLPAAPNTEAERFRVFDAVTRCLRKASKRRPLVLVLDDLHTADAASLILARFVVREVKDAAMVVVGTFRPAELSRGAPTRNLLGKLVREGRTLSLRGLSEAGTRRLVEALVTVPAEVEVISRVQNVTEGNPLFVTEILRLIATGAPGRTLREALEEMTVPERVVEAVRGRFEGLSDRTREILSIGAVIGREFQLAVLERVANATQDETGRALEPAIERRILTQLPAPLGTYRFTHILLRDVLYDSLGAVSRAEIHGRVGEILESVAASGGEPTPAHIAHHFLLAALDGASERASVHSVAAGTQALATLAFEEAAGHFERALHALRFEEGKEDRRFEILLLVGQAYKLAGDYLPAREAFKQALVIARQQADPVRIATAGLGYVDVKPESSEPARNTEMIPLLEEIVRVLAEAAGNDETNHLELRALALCRLALYRALSHDKGPSDAESRESVAIARMLGRPLTLAYVLAARHWVLWGPGTTEERLALSSEIIGLEHRVTDTRPIMEARLGRITDLLELGRKEELERAVQEQAQLAEKRRDPMALWNARFVHAMQALRHGLFDEAETHADDALRVGKRLQYENAHAFHAAQLGWIRMEQGRAAEIEPAFRAMLSTRPAERSLRAGLIRIHVEMGDIAAVRHDLEEFTPQRMLELEEGWVQLPTLSHLAAASALVGDAVRARAVRDRLSPHDGTHVVAGPAVVYLGPVSFYLGLCARATLELAEAIACFERAIAECSPLAARPTAARALLELAEAVGPADLSRAGAAARQALTIGRELGMQNIERRARAVIDRRGRDDVRAN